MTELAIGIVCPHCLAKPAAKLVTGHWLQGTWGQVALAHADTISTQYLHKFIAKFCRHIYQILSIIYYLHTLCSRGAPGLRQVTWWCVLWLPPTAPRHAPTPATQVFHKNIKAATSSSGRTREPQKKCGLSFSIHRRFCRAQFTVALWKKINRNEFIPIWNEFIPDLISTIFHNFYLEWIHSGSEWIHSA